MINRLHIEGFLAGSENALLLDVRSPSEYIQAHIPGAISFPLFTDEERKVVGTSYKQESRENAIKIGLDYFGPRMRPMIEEVEKILNGTDKPIYVHCWRGGMRSGGVAWLLDLYGFKVSTLEGGYKAFRNWVLKQFLKEYNLMILGGYTGSSKTELLKHLAFQGHQTIDLENLANHRGSALGGIGRPPQPSQEMFENLLATALARHNINKAIWLEDESQRIGDRNIPNDFMAKMRISPLFFLDVPFDKRLDYLLVEYGTLPADRVKESILRIKKRLGGLETKNAIQYLEEGNIRRCFEILLTYYDKFYGKALTARKDQLKTIETANCDVVTNAELLLKSTN
ncbi:MAG: tRNA 2-selenouridine(34) synthase MnmH [Cytophagales bacterium]|nr:tRNA 2-selenouridine(34) synthase MnmH [Cytophagales bacterium]